MNAIAAVECSAAECTTVNLLNALLLIAVAAVTCIAAALDALLPNIPRRALLVHDMRPGTLWLFKLS